MKGVGQDGAAAGGKGERGEPGGRGRSLPKRPPDWGKGSQEAGSVGPAMDHAPKI